MAKVETFIFGEKAPIWFDDEASKGRVRLFRDEEGNIISAKIMSGTKTYDVHKGDSIVKTISGLSVIPSEKAKKYGVQKNNTNTKEEAKTNNEGV